MGDKAYRLSRRDMLKVVGVGALGLAGCTVGRRGQPPATTTQSEVAGPTAGYAPSAPVAATPTPFPATTAAATSRLTTMGSLANAMLGTPTVDATFNSLALEIPYTLSSGSGQNLAASIQFRPSGTTAWRNTLPPQNVWHNAAWDDTTSGSIYHWDGGLTAFYGSILLLDPGTSYDWLVTVSDGSGGSASVSGTTTTRAEDIPDAATLTPTHYVDATHGSDANPGTSPTSAWQTLTTALTAANSAAADMVIRFAPGYYPLPTTPITLTGNGHRITLTAQFPAVSTDASGNRVLANAGQRSIFYQPTYTTPAGSGLPNSGLWTQVTLPGHNGSYPCWKAAFLPLAQASGNFGVQNYGVNRVAVAPDMTSLPRQLTCWKYLPATNGSGTTWTWTGGDGRAWSNSGPAYATEVISANMFYRYGYSSWLNGASPTSTSGNKSGEGYGTDVYLVMPPLPRADGTLSDNPNDFYVNVAYRDESRGYGQLWINGPNLRVSGFETRFCDLAFQTRATRGVADHNYVTNGTLFMQATPGSPSWTSPATYPQDIVFQYNWVQNTNSTADGTPLMAKPQPWQLVKDTTAVWMPDTSQPAGEAPADAPAGPWQEMSIEGEVGGIKQWGGARRGVVRYNTVSGGFDGLTNDKGVKFDRYNFYAQDWHDNLVTEGADDAFEPSQKVINLKVWGNRVAYHLNAFTHAYCNIGPVYVFRNQFWQVGAQHIGVNLDGHFQGGNTNAKFGDYIAIQPCRFYIVHNTYWTDDPQYCSGGAHNTTGWGAAGTAATSTTKTNPSQIFYLRNNIYRVSQVCWSLPGPSPATGWDEDYDLFATNYQNLSGLKNYNGLQGMPGTGFSGWDSATFSTPSAYVAAAEDGNGRHTNKVAGTTADFHSAGTVAAVDGLFVNAPEGSLTLVTGSACLNMGTPIPNISDLPGVNYVGTAPDLGALEAPE